MANFSMTGSTGKELSISLRGLSHEVCVAATQPEYWQQLIHNSSISITCIGNYVPVELESMCSEDEEPRLQLIVKSQHEQDNQQFDIICARIHYDLMAFENRDRPVYDFAKRQVVVFGSLYNSLPVDMFDTDRYLLGQRNCLVKKIRNSLSCSILISPMGRRYGFTIAHEKQTIMDLAVVQVQTLVRQAQDHYLLCYATKIARTLIGPTELLETMETNILASKPEEYPSFTPFQPSTKRKRIEEEEQQQKSTTNVSMIDSDQSDDETIPNERREQHREQVELLLNRICERMQARTPKDLVAKAREDSSQIKSYFRNTSALKTSTGDSDFAIELIEHEMDLRTRGMNEHKCTLVFNKQLKMGGGIHDRLKKTAKVRAYERLKTMTRDTPKECLILKPTRDGLWKAVIKPIDNK